MSRSRRDVKVTKQSRALASWVFVPMAIALALRLWGLSWGLPEIYEEATPFHMAWKMWGWGRTLHVDLNPHSFNYPSLTFYLHMAAQGLMFLVSRLLGFVHSTFDFRLLFSAHPTPFFLVARLLTVVFAVATVPLAFTMGRRASGWAAGLIAALFLALNPAHIDHSQLIEVDAPLTLFTAAACFLAMREAAARDRRNLVWGGVAAGLAASTKYPGAVAIVPLLAAVALGSRSRRQLLIGAAIAAASSLLAFALTSPYVILDRQALSDLQFERHHMAAGHFGGGESGWLFYGAAFLGRLGGPLLALGGLAGLVAFGLIRRERWALVLAAFVLPYFVLFASLSTQAERYALPLVPALCVFAAAALARASGALPWSRARVPMMALAALACVIPTLLQLPAIYARARPDTRTIAKQWIQAHCPEGTFVLEESLGPDLANAVDVAGMSSEAFDALRRRGDMTPLYAVQFLPMFQVDANRSAKFYDFSFCREMADLVITSGAVRERYQREPNLYVSQLAFYDSLDRAFVRVPIPFPRNAPGPELVVYRNPRWQGPWGDRSQSALPDLGGLSRGESTGEEPFYLYNLGLNYEVFGHIPAAVRCYRIGRQFPLARPGVPSSLDLGAARCLMALGRRDEALALLEQEEEVLTSIDQRKVADYRETILSGRP